MSSTTGAASGRRWPDARSRQGAPDQAQGRQHVQALARALPRSSGASSTAQIERTFDTKRAAEAWLLEQAHALHTGAHIDPRKADRPFSEVVAAYKETRYGSLTPKTRARYDSVLRKHLEPEFGRVGIGAVNRERVKRYFARLTAAGVPAGTVQKIHTVLSAVLSEAVELGMARSNMAAHLRLPTPQQRDMLFLTAQQVRELADAMPSHYRVAVYVAAYCGLRAGELWALRRMDVDALHGRLFLCGAASPTSAAGSSSRRPSPGATAPSSCPVPNTMLAEHLSNAPRREQARLCSRRRAVAVGRASATAARCGTACSCAACSGRPWWATPTTRIPPSGASPLSPTTCTGCAGTTCATPARACSSPPGRTPRPSRSGLGHASITTTLDRYGHLMPGLADALADALDDAHAAAAPPSTVARLPGG